LLCLTKRHDAEVITDQPSDKLLPLPVGWRLGGEHMRVRCSRGLANSHTPQPAPNERAAFVRQKDDRDPKRKSSSQVLESRAPRFRLASMSG
jgi:hypothetical protein